jgi:hypothetical protein
LKCNQIARLNMWYKKPKFVVSTTKFLHLFLYSKIMCLQMNFTFPKLPPLGSPQVTINMDENYSKFKIQTPNVQWSILIRNSLYIQKQCNLPTPLTLPLLYSRFRPQNPYEIAENEMKSLCNLLSFWLPNYSFCSLSLYNNQGFCAYLWICILTSSSTNLLYVSTSSGYILDYFTFVVGVVSIYCYFWTIYGSFSSWPLPLNTYGSLVCTSSWTIPLGLASFSSSWPNVSILVRLPQKKSKFFFWYTSNLYWCSYH